MIFFHWLPFIVRWNSFKKIISRPFYHSALCHPQNTKKHIEQWCSFGLQTIIFELCLAFMARLKKYLRIHELDTIWPCYFTFLRQIYVCLLFASFTQPPFASFYPANFWNQNRTNINWFAILFHKTITLTETLSGEWLCLLLNLKFCFHSHANMTSIIQITF